MDAPKAVSSALLLSPPPPKPACSIAGHHPEAPKGLPPDRVGCSKPSYCPPPPPVIFWGVTLDNRCLSPLLPFQPNAPMLPSGD